MHRRSSRLVVALAGLIAVGCSGATQPGTEAAKPSGTTIEIAMVDNAFHPAEIAVAKGERVTLRFTNKGTITHEAFLGDAGSQADHERQMSHGSSGGISHHGDHTAMSGEGSSSVTLEPDRSGAITHVFDRSGRTEIACHEPGHYTAGMKIAVTVA